MSIPKFVRERNARAARNQDGGFAGVCSDKVHVKQDDDLCANATRPCAGCNCSRFTAEEKAVANAIADKYKPVGVKN